VNAVALAHDLGCKDIQQTAGIDKSSHSEGIQVFTRGNDERTDFGGIGRDGGNGFV
jgi:hypothetical protein